MMQRKIYKKGYVVYLDMNKILSDYFWGMGMSFFVAGLLILAPKHLGSEYILIILGLFTLALAVYFKPKE